MLNSQVLLSNADWAWCKENNVKITTPGDFDYPKIYEDLVCRPAFLFYLGEPIWLHRPLISVVGSRSPSIACLNWLDSELSRLIRMSRLGVVSGGARGVDQKAHQMALRCRTATCAFLPSGLGQVYPPQFHEWIKPITESGGCVISQFLPSQFMRKGFFRERNRLIAAISPFTLVAECRRRSGTLLTANYAIEFERTLGVLPTFPGESGMGGLDLICDSQAHVIRDAEDIILLYGQKLL
jgi:DNA processing protein